MLANQSTPPSSSSMPGSVDSNPTTNSSNPGDASTLPPTKKRFSPKMIIGGLFLVLLVIGLGAGYYLTQMQQDLRQQASTDPYCPAGSTRGSGSSEGLCRCSDGTLITPSGSCASTPSCSSAGSSRSACENLGDPCRQNSNGCWEPVENSCGDGNCANGETTNSCPTDCGTGQVSCSPGSTRVGSGSYEGLCRCGDGRYVQPGASCSTTGDGGCTPGTCVNGKRCEVDPVSGGGYVGTHNCTVGGNCTNNPTNCSPSEYCDNSTNTCKSRRSTGTACSDGTQCASGQCVSGRCEGTSTNISCTTDATCPSGFLCRSGKCSQATGQPDDDGGTGGPGDDNNTGDQCTIAALQSCEGNGCCANGGVCQGVAGSRVCQIPTTSPDAQCGTGTCTGWYGFKCDSLTSTGECLSNGQRFSSRSAAESHAGSCGQIDQVCVGGDRDGQLCGDFTIFNGSCGNPPASTPPSSNPPASEPPAGPQCLSISLSNNTPAVGDSLNFTCGVVPNVSEYRFRVVEPDGTILELAGKPDVPNQSRPYLVESAGSFKVQCTICPNGQCQAFENLN